MSIYDINGKDVTRLFDIKGSETYSIHDINGNIVYDSYLVGRTLTFEDSFRGTHLDGSKWGYEIGYVRNNELQFYKEENATIEDGMLVLTAKREEHKGFAWTSASIHTNNKFEQAYGRFEAKIKFPGVVGSFPAFWLLGGNYEMIYHDDGSIRDVASEIRWPQCGEVDIVEIIPGNSTRAQANLWKYSGGSLGGGYSHAIDVTKWHVYAVEWTTEGMEMSVDGIVYKKYDFASLGETNIQAYRLPHYIILNLAVGAAGGTPSADNNEMKMYVDWVRVYAPLET